jgi:RNA 2',3'-cyclic 3'-phosphodiesterase
MRVFIAIDIPEDIRKRLGTVQDQLRSFSPSARWVAPDSIHLTLKFIGEIAEKRRDEIDEALADLTWKAFPVTVRGVGFFPGMRSPRVFWAGLQCPTMEGLAKEIDARLEPAGFEPEERAFRAHVTLARSKSTRLENGLVTAAEKFTEADFGTFIVDRCFLYQSTLKSGGALYTKLKEYPL